MRILKRSEIARAIQMEIPKATQRRWDSATAIRSQTHSDSHLATRKETRRPMG
jgi:hypothetical protein